MANCPCVKGSLFKPEDHGRLSVSLSLYLWCDCNVSEHPIMFSLFCSVLKLSSPALICALHSPQDNGLFNQYVMVFIHQLISEVSGIDNAAEACYATEAVAELSFTWLHSHRSSPWPVSTFLKTEGFSLISAKFHVTQPGEKEFWILAHLIHHSELIVA